MSALDDALVEHRIGDLQEATDVRSSDVVAGHTELVGSGNALRVDRLHDAVQALVDLLAGCLGEWSYYSVSTSVD